MIRAYKAYKYKLSLICFMLVLGGCTQPHKDTTPAVPKAVPTDQEDKTHSTQSTKPPLSTSASEVIESEEDFDDYTALFQACQNEYPERLEQLFQQGVKVNKQQLGALLYNACYGYDEYGQRDKCVALLLKHGADANFRTDSGNTPLHHATNAVRMQMLLDHGADVNTQNEAGNTPLAPACSRGLDACIKLLIKNGAKNINQMHYNWTLLHDAASAAKDPETIALLIDHGAHLHARGINGATPLHLACRNNTNRAIINMLLNRGADKEAQDDDGNTPLFEACAERNMIVVETLLEHGAACNIRNTVGKTPLHIACFTGIRCEPYIVHQLIRHGATINAHDNMGMTPLHLAATKGFIDAVGPLVTHGATIDQKDSQGLTPLHLACQKGAKACYAFLVSKGADVNAQDHAGRTPLHLACQSDHDTCTKFLISKGAHSNAQDSTGKTPLQYARAYAQHYNRQSSCMQVLANHEAVSGQKINQLS